MLPYIANPETIAFLDAMATANQAYIDSLLADDSIVARRVQRARAYHDGDQFVKLTDRLREFLGDDLADGDADMLCLNICHTIVNAVSERLLVRGFDTDEQPNVATDDAGNAITQPKQVAGWASDVWQHNRMDVRQDDIHETALRDGSAFLIVDWPAGAQWPCFTTQPRYVDPSAGGDGQGCKVVYQNNDPDQPALFAVKRWTETIYTTGVALPRYRMTVYYPDVIERYYSDGGGLSWHPYTEPEDPEWRIPWVDDTGAPLGIAVIPFRNHGDDQEARKAIPIQNAINKSMVDLMQESDMAAFRILIALGWEPLDQDGEPLTLESGRWYGTTNPDGKVQEIGGTEFKGFLDAIDFLTLKAAQVTDTPASRFLTTRQVAAEATLKQQDSPLINKIRKRQARLGNGYEDAMALGLRLHNTYGPAAGLPALPAVTFETLWEPAESRDEKSELETAKMKREVLDIPVEVLQAEAGYPQDKIDEWAAERAQRKAEMAATLAQQPPGDPPVAAGLPPGPVVQAPQLEGR